jgi:hypothetical protein
MGRQKQTEKDFLKGMLWFRAVSVRLGNASAYALEKHFDPLLFSQRDGKLTRSKKWDRYRDGKRLPSDVSSDDIVARVDRELPGTAKWFRSPLWAAIDGSFSDRYVIDTLLRSLEDVHDLIFHTTNEGDVTQIKRRPADDAFFDSLIQISSMDTLAAILLMAREAEVIASPQLRENALHAYLQFQPKICAMPEFSEIADRLFWHIDTTVKHWSLVHPNRRLDIVIFSRELRSSESE